MYAFLVIPGLPKGPGQESITTAHVRFRTPALGAPGMTNLEMLYDCAPASPLAGSSCTDSPQPQAAV
jgi:hypothetical protein